MDGVDEQPPVRTLLEIVTAHNRERTAHALIGLAVGIGATLLVYLFVFWLSWLGAWFTIGLHGQRPLHLALGVTGLLFIVSVGTAWRGIEPMQAVDLRLTREEALVREVEDFMGLMLHIPIIRRETLGWTAKFLIGGPATMLEAWADWRGRIPFNAATLARWERVLDDAKRERLVSDLERVEDLSALHHLGLVKMIYNDDGRLHLALTRKGANIG